MIMSGAVVDLSIRHFHCQEGAEFARNVSSMQLVGAPSWPSSSFLGGVSGLKISRGRRNPLLQRAVNGQDRSVGEGDEEKSKEDEFNGDRNNLLRESLERIVGNDDAKFSGIDLAMIIRKKYGRSYDVQLIKKEFMGKNLLAMNVMWKYREQRSFPLTEEEYLLRLDDVANTLKCWGAVSHIRNSLAKSKERPRIGKAVSIFIDMDESGARSNEWIYR